MKTKTLLTIAILLALPFGAWADELTITNADKQHIASTAYVKGAYNDAMAAVSDKQNKLEVGRYNDPETGEWTGGTDVVGVIDSLRDGAPAEYLVNAQAVDAAMRAQRVKIYTTWDGNGTKNVEIEQLGLETPQEI